jgi:hypothetical protein
VSEDDTAMIVIVIIIIIIRVVIMVIIRKGDWGEKGNFNNWGFEGGRQMCTMPCLLALYLYTPGS